MEPSSQVENLRKVEPAQTFSRVLLMGVDETGQPVPMRVSGETGNQIAGGGAQTITLTGDVTGSGTTNIVTAYNGIVPVSKGGLNTSTAPSTAQIPVASGVTAYAPVTVSGAVTINSSGVTTLGTGVVGYTNLTSAAKAAVQRKNMLINPQGTVNQLVTAATADNAYGLDQWRLELEAANAAIYNQGTTTNAPTTAKNSHHLVVGAGNNNKFGIFQVIEGVDIYAARGKTVTLSAQIKATAGISDVRMAILLWTGTEDNGGTAFPDPITTWGSSGGGITSYNTWVALNTAINLNVTTGFLTYSVSSASTVSTSATNLAVFIWNDDRTTTTTTDTLSIGDVQLEIGDAATDLEQRPFQQEVALCQRFYAKSFNLTTAPVQNSGTFVGTLEYKCVVAGATANGVMLFFPVHMRATPNTFTTYNPSAANALWRKATAGADSGASSTGGLSEGSNFVQNAQAAGDLAGATFAVHWSADARL